MNLTRVRALPGNVTEAKEDRVLKALAVEWLGCRPMASRQVKGVSV